MHCPFRLFLFGMFAALVFATHCVEASGIDSEYAQRLSVIKIIPFDERSQEYQPITESRDTQVFKEDIKATLIRTVVKTVPWINPFQDELAALDVSHISADTVDGLVSRLIDHMQEKITDLRATQLSLQSFDSAHSAEFKIDTSEVAVGISSTPDDYLVPDPFLLFNACRVDIGRFMAQNDHGDVEVWGFRRYLRNPKRKATDPDCYRFSEFNYGRAFVYPKQVELQQLGIAHPFGLLPDQHRLITNAVSSYAKQNYNEENVLFVSIFVRVGETILHRITCGMFISGTSQPSSRPIRDIFGGTTSVKLSLIQNNWKAFEHLTSGVMPQKAEDLTEYFKCYDKKPFLHPHGSRRFPPVSGTTDRIRPQIKAILGLWKEQPSKDNVPIELVDRIELLYGESPVLSRVDIYGENELKGVLRSGKDGAFGTCFHQSEQHFLALLDSSLIEIGQLGDHLHVDRYVNSLPIASGADDSDSIADNVVVCCYSRKDICRYCRSTFSHMMSSRAINNKVCSFVNKIFDDIEIFTHPHHEIPVEFYAFAKETTEL